MSRSIPPAALALLAAVLVLGALPPIGVNLAPLAAAGHAIVTEPTRLAWALNGGVVWADDRFLVFGNGAPGDAGAYDAAADEATGSAAALDEDMLNVYLAWSGSVAYLFGFEAPGRDVIYAYDPATDDFALEPGLLPSARYQLGGVWDPRDLPGQGCASGCLYVFGGADIAQQRMLPDIVRYNPETGVAALVSTQLPFGVGRMGAVWDPVRSVAYVFGGQSSWFAGIDEDDILAFDPVAGTVTTAGLLPMPGIFTQGAWVAGKLYVVSMSWPDKVAEFDPATGTSTFLPITIPGIGASRVASDGVANLYSFWDGVIRRYALGPHPPIAIMSPIFPVTCIGGRGSAALSAIASFDPDGGPVTFEWWSPDDVTYDVATSPRPIASAPVGTSKVKVTVGDGTFETTTTGVTTVVDLVPPVTTATLAGLPGNPGWWRSPVTVDLDARDVCGIEVTQHGVNGPPVDEGARVTVGPDGSHVVQYRSVDLGGNVETTRSIPFQIDQTPPALALARPAEGKAYALDMEVPFDQDATTATVVVGDVTLNATANDATSGVERVEFHVDGVLRGVAVTDPYEFLWAAGAEPLGPHEVRALAFDVAGNSASVARNVTTLPTTVQGVVGTADLGAGCRVVLGPDQCDALQATIEQLDPAPTVNLVRDTINEFLRECEETLSRTVCQFLPDELPGSGESRAAPGPREPGITGRRVGG